MAEDKKQKEASDQTKALSKKDIIAPEVADVLRSEQNAQVNINMLVVQLTNNTTSPHESLEATEKAFELAQKFEKARLDNFRARSDAIIDTKNRDPDEIEKRANNRTRRHLKYGLVVSGVTGLGGGLTLALSGGSIVASGLLLAIGALSVGMMGPLASGESVSSNDVVKIISSIRSMIPSGGNDDGKGKKK